MKKLASVLLLSLVATLGCTNYAGEPFDPSTPLMMAFVFTQESSSINYEGFYDRGLILPDDISVFPFLVESYSSGDSLIQKLNYEPTGGSIVEGYSLPSNIGAGRLFPNLHTSIYYEYYAEDYQKPDQPSFEELEIVGQPIEESELDFNSLWNKIDDNPILRQYMSSENVRLGLIRFKPYTDSNDLDGATYTLIIYTY